jgi:hypothetical protein
MDVSKMKLCAEFKQMQLDEIMALEAIFTDTDNFLVAEASNLERLRELIEECQMDEDNGSVASICSRTPTPCHFICNKQLTMSTVLTSWPHLCLRITYPQLYPLGGSPPLMEISYFMVTDKTVVCSPDKPLESLAYLEEIKLQEAFATESQQILPDPSVYEVAVTWLPRTCSNS